MRGFVYCDTDSVYLGNLTPDEIAHLKQIMEKYTGIKREIKSKADGKGIVAECKKQNEDLAKTILRLSEELDNLTKETAELAAENKHLFKELEKVRYENIWLTQQYNSALYTELDKKTLEQVYLKQHDDIND